MFEPIRVEPTGQYLVIPSELFRSSLFDSMLDSKHYAEQHYGKGVPVTIILLESPADDVLDNPLMWEYTAE